MECIHGMKIYTLKDGTLFYSCSACNPEYQDALAKRQPRNVLVGEPASEDTLEWLSANCVIHASVPLWSESEFVSNYREIKGKDLVFNEYVKRHGAKSKERKNWYDMSIRFSAEKEGLSFNNSLNVIVKGNTARVYSCDMVWKLLEYGFDFGKNHNYK